MHLALFNISAGLHQNIAGETHYMIGDKRFPALCITEQTMREAVTATEELEMIKWEEMDRVTDIKTKPTGHSGVYCMLARKV